MKRGFTLIELMIATLIASMIVVGLLTALSYTTRIQTNIDNTSSITMRLASVKRQMERDIGGFFAPRPVIEKEEEEPAEEEKKEGEAAQKTEQAEKEAPKKPPKPVVKEVQHVFKLDTQDGRLKQLTFITDNAMQVYWGSKQDKPVPRAARVVYRLKEDEKRHNSFALTRQEGYALDLNAYKSGDANAPRIYPIIEGIKELTVSVYTLKVKEQQEGEKEQETSSEKAEYEKAAQWEYPLPEEKQKEKPKTALLPRFIEIKLTLWDNQYKYDQIFTFTLPIVVQAKGYKVVKPEAKPPQQQAKPQAPKPGEAPRPQPGAQARNGLGASLLGGSQHITQQMQIERRTVNPQLAKSNKVQEVGDIEKEWRKKRAEEKQNYSKRGANSWSGRLGGNQWQRPLHPTQDARRKQS